MKKTTQLAIFVATLIVFISVVAVAETFRGPRIDPRMTKNSSPQMIYRAAGIDKGELFYGEWNSNRDLVQGWVNFGNEKFPQFQYHVEHTDDKVCIEKFLKEQDMKDCTSKK